MRVQIVPRLRSRSASSSIEGNTTSNEKLQAKRAESIIKVLQKNQSESIKTKIETYIDCDHFYTSIASLSEWKFLAGLEKDELLEKVNNGLSDKLESILAKERRANINLYCTIDTTTKNLTYLIRKEYNALLDSIYKNHHEVNLNLYKLDKLYQYTYKLVVSSKIDSNILAKLAVPNYYNSYIPLCEKFIQYGYRYPEIYRKNRTWTATKENMASICLANQSTRCSRNGSGTRP